MKGNRGRNTKPELTLRLLLREAGYPGYRLHWKKAPGRPDVAYPGRRVAIFVNGCFWHQHPGCAKATMPKRNGDFWRAKLAANRARDAAKANALRARGFRVVTIWECETTDPARVRRRLGRLTKPPSMG